MVGVMLPPNTARVLTSIAILMGMTLGFSVGRVTAPKTPQNGVPLVPSAAAAPAVSAVWPGPAEPNYGAKESECRCGATQTCPFGPSIVGRRTCHTGVSGVNIWSRCEPVEK
jgi:hypothetical protein